MRRIRQAPVDGVGIKETTMLNEKSTSTETLPDVRTNHSATSSATVPMQEASLDIWDKKYRLKDKAGRIIDADIDATYQRVAERIASVEPKDQAYWAGRFLWALRLGAIPAGRITSNAGAEAHKPATSTINCTVSGTIPDSMDGILEKVHEAGRWHGWAAPWLPRS